MSAQTQVVNMKLGCPAALIIYANLEKALVGAFSVIVMKTVCGTDGALHSTIF